MKLLNYKITTQKLEKLLLIEYFLDLKLNDEYLYIKIDNEEGWVISVLNKEINLQYEKFMDFALSIGLPILINRYKKNTILPTIMDFIIDIPTLSVNSDQSKKITFGKKITFIEKEGFYIVKDKFSRNIALATIQNKLLIPIIDCGEYLHIEDEL